MQNEEYYGSPQSSETMPIRERLRRYYATSDFVTVINVDTKPLKYQFMRPEGQETFQPSPYESETHNLENPRVVTLQPGETKLCPAYEADLMIENLIKQISSSKTQDLVDAGTLRPDRATTNWSDPQLQTDLIEEIFLGKQDLVGQFNAQNVRGEVEKELELEPAEPARRGRPPKSE